MVTQPRIRFADLSLAYAGKPALKGVSFDIQPNTIHAIIGPAGSGKSTLLTCINRLSELSAHAVQGGRVELDGEDVRGQSVTELRRRVAMVLPLPVGLPMSVYDNVAFAPRMAGMPNGPELDQLVRSCLERSALWDEVCDRLDMLGTRLSGGQQQRLTLARALSTRPDVLCLDEFSIAIDPVTTMRIEAVLTELRSEMTIVLVTNLLAQARRIASRTAFLLDGSLVEENTTDVIFGGAADARTRDYVSGVFG